MRQEKLEGYVCDWEEKITSFILLGVCKKQGCGKDIRDSWNCTKVMIKLKEVKEQ